MSWSRRLQAAGVKRCYGIVGDTLNRIAHAIDRSEIEWVHMRHEEAGAFAAGAEAQFTGASDGLRRQLRPGQPPFHQWALRSQPQSRAGHPDRDPDRAAGHRVRIDPGGRLQ